MTGLDAASMELVPCNLCGRDDFTVVFDSPPRASAAGEISDFVASTDRFDCYGRIVRCRGCGLVYANPRPARARLIESYGHVVDHEYAEENASRSINAHLGLHTLRRFVGSGRLLDVGCATGYFLNAARLHFETQGLEPSEWAADFARTQLRLDVVTGDFESAVLPAASFDVVTLIDVIEHVADPKSALRKAAELLRSGGWLYLVTPDIASLSARVLRGKWWGLRPAHLYYFSPLTLASMLESAGFRVEFQSSYGRMFTYQYWLSRLRSYPPPLYHGAARLVSLFRVENKFLYLNTRDSLEICARKS